MEVQQFSILCLGEKSIVAMNAVYPPGWVVEKAKSSNLILTRQINLSGAPKITAVLECDVVPWATSQMRQTSGPFSTMMSQ